MDTNGICAVFGAVGRHRVRVTAFAKGGGLPLCAILGCIDERSALLVASRVRAAAEGSGFSWPREEVLVNVVPSAGPLVDGAIDLAVAAAVLGATGQLPQPSLAGKLFCGELDSSGAVVRAADPFGLFLAANPDMDAVCGAGTAPDGVGLCRVATVSRLGDLRAL